MPAYGPIGELSSGDLSPSPPPILVSPSSVERLAATTEDLEPAVKGCLDSPGTCKVGAETDYWSLSPSLSPCPTGKLG